ncbi:MAG: hypothetical protein ACI8QZ_000723 [Chlamydiales bacterium]|jgi:hypothetical protein
MPKHGVSASRAFWLIALGLSALVALTQALALRSGWESNPLAQTPLMDAEVYWRWAGAIARGELQAETPFVSAPLYPYLLGALRFLGADVFSVCALQIALHAATGLLLAIAGRRAFGPGVGLLAACLYFGTSDPAYYTARILSSSTVALLSTLTLVAAQAVAQRASVARAAGLGIAVGALCLGHPPMLVSVPLFALWAGWQAEDARWRPCVATLIVALATIAPATIHNFRATGEVIPISAQAGITFYHGNQPGADGTYSVAQGVSTDRGQQNIDALDRARQATGDGSWKSASQHFFGLGLDYWRDSPIEAARLFMRKAYWFLSGRVYGDIYMPVLEREHDLPVQSRWAPIPLALLTWSGILATWMLLRDPRRHLPIALLTGVPLLVVCVFWYSPRYRLPAAPTLALAAAYALVEIRHWRERPRAALALTLGFVAAGTALLVNPSMGFDSSSRYQAQFDYALGNLYLETERPEQARACFLRGREAGHAHSAVALADLKRRAGDPAGAVAELERAVEVNPSDAYARRSLATALAESSRWAEARKQFEASLALDPNNWTAVTGLGNVFLNDGQIELAIRQYEQALALNPDFGDARFNLAMAYANHSRPKRIDLALAQVREALRRDPQHARCQEALEWLLEQANAGAE